MAMLMDQVRVFCTPLLFLLFFLSSACTQPLPPALREQQSNLWLCRAMHQELAGGQGGGGARRGEMLSQGCSIASLHTPPNPACPCELSPASSVSSAGSIPRDTPKLLGCTPVLKQSALASEGGSPSPLGYHGEGGGTGARQRSPSGHCTALQQGGSLWLDCPRQGSPLAMLMPENSLYFFFSRQPSVLVILLRPGAQHVVPCPCPPHSNIKPSNPLKSPLRSVLLPPLLHRISVKLRNFVLNLHQSHKLKLLL